MRVIIDINHPAHVHLFKHTISELKREGHTVKVTARDKDITLELLSAYNIEYSLLSTERSGIQGLALEYATRLKGMYSVAKSFDPDVYISLNPAIAHVSSVIGGKSIILHDHEPAKLKEYMFSSFADIILSPECFERDLGSNHTKYPGYHELAYLHPNRFSPDESVLEGLDVTKEDKFVIMRTVSWDASHDIGESGIKNSTDVVEKIENCGATVYITSERDIPEELKPNQLSVSPEKIHDLMYFSDLYVGESPTMATESAVLGTPAVLISSSSKHFGNTRELKQKYKLVFNYSEKDKKKKGLAKSISILRDDDVDKWNKRNEKLIDEKIDTTDFILERITEGSSDKPQ